MSIFVIVSRGLGGDWSLVIAFTNKSDAWEWLRKNPSNEIVQYEWMEVELHN